MRKIKKVIAWFGKRPTLRALIVAYAILSMILALAGAWSSSLLSLSCFLAFLLNDSHIEPSRGKTKPYKRCSQT